MALLILFLLILLNGFFALSEIAFVAARRRKLEQLAAAGNTRAQAVIQLMERPQFFLSSIQVGITLIAIVSGVYGGFALVETLAEWLNAAGWPATWIHKTALLITVGGITYFSVVLGELVPKSMAIQHAESIAMATVPMVRRFSLLLYPFVWVLTGSTRLVCRALGIREVSASPVSEEELRYMLKTAGKLGVLEVEESQVIQNLFAFTDQVAQSLMTQRSKVQWIDRNWSTPEILDFLRRTPGTKFPVARQGLDQLEGVLYAKDFLDQYTRGDVDLDSLIRDPVFLAPNTPAFHILARFRDKKQYIGFVLDEYGHVKGLVTLRDLIEALIGDLPDEFEPPEQDIIRREDGSWLVNAHIPIIDLNQYFQQEVIPDAPLHYSTLAGFVIFRLQRLPVTGETLDLAGCRLEVVDMDGKRIDKVVLTLSGEST
jgi:putative hemolysin